MTVFQLNIVINEPKILPSFTDRTRENCRALRSVCLSVGVMDVCGDQSVLVALVNQRLELPLSPSFHPSSSCVTGPTQEQLLLPLPVSTALHQSPSKPLLVSVCV